MQSPDWYQVFKDFASPLATTFAAIVAAGIAASIAFRQWKTARLQADIALDKLKFDTFEDRHAVVIAAKKLIAIAVLHHPEGKEPIEAMNALAQEVYVGRFYFGPSLFKKLDALVKISLELKQAGSMRSHFNHDAALSRENFVKINHLRSELFKIQQELYKEFEFDLSLNLLRHGSERDYRAAHKTPSSGNQMPLALAIFGASVVVILSFIGALR